MAPRKKKAPANSGTFAEVLGVSPEAEKKQPRKRRTKAQIEADKKKAEAEKKRREAAKKKKEADAKKKTTRAKSTPTKTPAKKAPAGKTKNTNPRAKSQGNKPAPKKNAKAKVPAKKTATGKPIPNIQENIRRAALREAKKIEFNAEGLTRHAFCPKCAKISEARIYGIVLSHDAPDDAADPYDSLISGNCKKCNLSFSYHEYINWNKPYDKLTAEDRKRIESGLAATS